LEIKVDQKSTKNGPDVDQKVEQLVEDTDKDVVAKKKTDSEEEINSLDNDDETDDIDANISTKSWLKINYSQQEEHFLAEEFYKSHVDYDKLFSYNVSPGNRASGVYQQELAGIVSDTRSETMQTEEAEKMLINIQYAKVLGTMTSLNHSDRERFSNWVNFNPALWKLFHSNYSITDDIDYAKSF